MVHIYGFSGLTKLFRLLNWKNFTRLILFKLLCRYRVTLDWTDKSYGVVQIALINKKHFA